MRNLVSAAFLLGALAACSPNLSPDTYATAAVQQANKVEQGVVVGVRQVRVDVAGTAGAVTGGAAGGIVGSQAPGGSVTTAFGTLGGALVGGLIGSGVEKAAGATRAFEYVVRKPGGDLVSVTQWDRVPLRIGEKVLVIAGAQARIVPDYTVPPEAPAPSTPEKPGGTAEPPAP